MTTSRAAAGSPNEMFEIPSTVLTYGIFSLISRMRFDGLDRAADVVGVAGGAGKHQRIDDDVFGGNAVLLGQQLDGTLRHRQLALAREGLRLQLVFVDAAHDQRRAVSPRDGTDALEFLLAVFQVDGVDDALALAIGQRQFDGAADRWCRS